MSLTEINNQLERFIAQTQSVYKIQAAHIMGMGPVLHPMLKELREVLKESHEAVKQYRKEVEGDVNRRRKNLAEEQYEIGRASCRERV